MGRSLKEIRNLENSKRLREKEDKKEKKKKREKEKKREKKNKSENVTDVGCVSFSKGQKRFYTVALPYNWCVPW